MSDEEKFKRETIKEMEMQFHGQFSSNYDNGFSSTVTLFCTLLAVLAGYGYIFLHSSSCFEETPNCLCCSCSSEYKLDALIWVTAAANIVLAIMKYICLCQGVNLRLEQFIVHAIRTKYYGKDPTSLDDPKIFPTRYTPFGKKGDDIVVGMYGTFVNIICSLQVLVMLGCVYKLIWNIVDKADCGLNINGFFALLFLVVVSIICYGQYQCLKEEILKKYKKRHMEYWLNITTNDEREK